jgi:DNA-directed RNA polymerase II subunit RPB2
MSETKDDSNEDSNEETKTAKSFDKISWKIIQKYFKYDPYNLVAHHLDSYNDFFDKEIFNVFKDNNPIRFSTASQDGPLNKINMFLGGKDGKSIYYGKPVLYDTTPEFEGEEGSDGRKHYMYPNEARLRNLTYGITIHYDVVVELEYQGKENLPENKTITLEKIYLGKFPIMLHSTQCILKGMARDLRYNLGECRNDHGGYFIIDGKEKVIVSQEKFADNMLYVSEVKGGLYSHVANIRSVSEDSSKPKRTTSVRILAPTAKLSNNNILVSIPNVKKPIPLFIVMRALGVLSDKEIIETCLLNLEENKSLIGLFLPSIHDANKIFSQTDALHFIKMFTKRRSRVSVLAILMNYFLPHVGEFNLIDKAYYLGYMVNELLKVYTKEIPSTDRDSFKCKRVETSGALIKELFIEYYAIQRNIIFLNLDKMYEYKTVKFDENDFLKIFEDSETTKILFGDRVVEAGFKKAFKGSWGSSPHTMRVGLIQDLNRLTYYSFISHLRKLILTLDASAKVVEPRLLHSSQWGYIDPADSPDGGNIGLHKHLAVTTYISKGFSSKDVIDWLKLKFNGESVDEPEEHEEHEEKEEREQREEKDSGDSGKWAHSTRAAQRTRNRIRCIQECTKEELYSFVKVFVNGNWIGVVEDPIDMLATIKLYKRNGLLPVFLSCSFDYKNSIFIYTDEGRLYRPIYYVDKTPDQPTVASRRSSRSWKGRVSSMRNKEVCQKILNDDECKWDSLVTGFLKKPEGFNYKNNVCYTDVVSVALLQQNKCVVEYIDVAEEEYLLISNQKIQSDDKYTNVEIHPSLLFGVMGNQIIYPENNPCSRNTFSCAQGKQAVGIYHTNYLMRIDKSGIILNYGQTPLIKSKYLEFFNKEEQPCGNNVICAIMSYNGYNVEDAILINEASIQRGLFNTTYYSSYEAREEKAEIKETGKVGTNSFFTNIQSKEVLRTKPDYRYNELDEKGLVRENTMLTDKTTLIGKVIENEGILYDSSVFPKKGQLGYVDKSFITETDEGFRIAKIRIREERIPQIGDKMASRAGQKGTVGLIIKESDMPFTDDGIRPDLIINPHAIPSRMTIGQLLECLFGKVCLTQGCFGDGTTFDMNGPNLKYYGTYLIKHGFHSSGNQILYNGFTGEQMKSEIFIGPTYYSRLKHMVKDKINYRAMGPRTALTRQPVQGRANDGGLRIGEMERDGILAHGALGFLTESFLERGDVYFMAICNHTGMIAIYNQLQDIFLSPYADGPIEFPKTYDRTERINVISRFGRSFSIVRIPYALKLLIQEVHTMNVQMRIITEENIDQIKTMNYSNNILKLQNIYSNKESTLVDHLKNFVPQTNLLPSKPKPKQPKQSKQPKQPKQHRHRRRRKKYMFMRKMMGQSLIKIFKNWKLQN